ncbi:hypothetical protein NQ318_008155 [Aromia moschata]|uniref:Shootin-1 n=1 Tax=Aromia moschata TaxID=1265417 RepID=A0AAV8YNH8_9CUCU|nr:hypothetical protein NQ318_008155 [Aromia moschata]
MHNNRHTISCGKLNGSSNIPLRKQLSRQSSSPSTPSKIPINDPQAHRWKQKFEEVEERRKLLLTEKEKALRALTDVEKKYLNLQVKHEYLETELFEKNEEFTKLSTASKNLYKEYETLKNQYETETRAMSGGNIRLSRTPRNGTKKIRCSREKQCFCWTPTRLMRVWTRGETSSDDIENLNKTIKQLSTEVAELQTEVDSLKQIEFQTSEENAKLSEELENEKQKNERLTELLTELKKEHEQLIRVTDMMKKEMEEQKKVEEELRDSLEIVKKEANANKRERNVLAHQSTLILQNLTESSEGSDCMMLLQEIEDLKRTLEEDSNRHEEEISLLHVWPEGVLELSTGESELWHPTQLYLAALGSMDSPNKGRTIQESSTNERLEDQENNAQLEILEERLKLVEAELQAANERADKAEEKLKAPPIPPPPPPPPLLPPPAAPPVVPLRRRRSKIAMQELAETIGMQESSTSPEKKPAAPGVNEDIINAIKAGQFTLRKAKNDKEKRDKEQPKAVSELLNILGSLRRAPKKRQSQYIGDVQL